MSLSASLRQGILGWIYPPICSGCDLPLNSSRQRERPFLCSDCEDKLVRIPDGYCPVCGQSYEAPISSTFPCGNCGGRTLSFDFAVSAYRSGGEARQIMHAYKYGKQIHLSRLFGSLMQEVWRDSRLNREQSWLVVPVPLHPHRQRKRGFNQAHELAQEFIRCAPTEKSMQLAPILKRTRNTVRQAQLDRRDRLGNLSGAFQVRRKQQERLKEGVGILIVDDVMTTGATVSECARCLRVEAEKIGEESLDIIGLSVLRG